MFVSPCSRAFRLSRFSMFFVIALVSSACLLPPLASGQSVWDQLKAKAKQAAKPAQPAAAGQPAKPGQPAAKAGQPGAALDSGPITLPPGIKVDPALAGPYTQGALMTVSPHGVHVSLATNSGSRWVMLHDGVSSEKFDHVGYGGNGSGAVFSPDGEH